MADDLSLLGGLGQGLMTGLNVYNQERDRQFKIKQYQDEQEMKGLLRKQQQEQINMEATSKGLVPVASSDATAPTQYELGPEAQQERQSKLGLLGAQAEEAKAKASMFKAQSGQGGGRSKMQQQAHDKVAQALDTMRGQSAVQQAEKDLYAADKANTLYGMFKDPNQIDPQMFKLYTSEIGKIAQGQSPTVEELKGLNPSTFSGGLAKAWQSVTSNPTPANLGAFAKQYKNYADSVQGDAKKIINDRYGRIINSSKAYLHPDDLKAFEQEYLHRFDKQEGGGLLKQQQIDPDDQAAINYIKTNPQDVETNAALKAALSKKGIKVDGL